MIKEITDLMLSQDRKYSDFLSTAEEKLSEILSRLDESEKRIELMKQEVMDELDIL